MRPETMRVAEHGKCGCGHEDADVAREGDLGGGLFRRRRMLWYKNIQQKEDDAKPWDFLYCNPST